MEIFDGIAKNYDGWYTTKMGNFVDEIETKLALNMFSPRRGMKVLDVGCGTGNFSTKLARFGCRVTGIDVSENMLKIARHKAKEEKVDISQLLEYAIFYTMKGKILGIYFLCICLIIYIKGDYFNVFS